MRQLIAPTEDFAKLERTYLNADISSGSDIALTLANNNGMLEDTFICIGIEGSERAELQKINAPVSAGTIVQVATLLFPHKKGEPVTVYRFDKRKFYGATSIDGSYTELSAYGSPVSIQVDDPQGTLLEYSDSTFSYFKSTYYNSVTVSETSLSESDPIAGDQSLRYTTLYNIRKQAGLTNNPYVTDGTLETYRKRAENEVNSYIFNGYQLPLQDSTGANVVPFIIENCTVLLAAGYIDYQEFGKEGEGVKWLGEARGILKQIRDNKQRLIDSYGNEFAQKDRANTIQSYPDSVDNKNGPIRSFTTKQRF